MARRQNRAGETEEQAMKVADIHAHIFPEKLADKAPASISAFYGGMDVACHPATAENLVKFEHEAGITRFVMSNSATSAHQVRSINDFLPQAVKDVPGAIAFGSIFPGMDGAEEELERAKFLFNTNFGISEIALALGRGEVATCMKLFQLGLYGSKNRQKRRSYPCGCLCKNCTASSDDCPLCKSKDTSKEDA